MMTNKRQRDAKFQIINSQLVISIGLDSLKRSIELDTNFKVNEPEKAIFAINGVISSEEENGRTPFHSMLASAAYQAYEDGEEGFDEKEQQKKRSWQAIERAS